MPRVSVCIPEYNYPEFLPAAIESVLRQTLDDFELLIVDDCSPGASLDVAGEYASRDPRVRLHRNAANVGMVPNWNACLRLATGEYVKYLHADDFLCAPDALERMAGLLDAHPGVSLVASAVRSVDAGSETLGLLSPFHGDRTLAGRTAIARCLLSRRNLVGPPSATMFRRCQAGRGFDERLGHAADLEMWLHLLTQGDLAYVSEPLAAYRWHPSQETAKNKATLSEAADWAAIVDTYLDLPPLGLPAWIRRCVRHEAVRQVVRRARRLGRREEAEAAVARYGRARYVREQPFCWAWRRIGKATGLWEALYARG